MTHGGRRRTIGLVWENFGPPHDDRCNALAIAMAGEAKILGIELHEKSHIYSWVSCPNPQFDKISLSGRLRGGFWAELSETFRLTKAIVSHQVSDVFFCNYERPAIFLSACLTRLMLRRSYILLDSKFDDFDRYLWREMLKRLFFTPYTGAIAGSARTRDYLVFHGFRSDQIKGGYDTIDIDRVQRAARRAGAVAFSERPFIVIARLVDAKNLPVAIKAYAHYRENGGERALIICGDGPLDIELANLAKALGIADHVEFKGFVQSEETLELLGSALALLLPSRMETFGFAIIEALAAGIPAIVSMVCGARDQHVRTGVNGFVVESDNPEGFAFFMLMIDRDQALWQRMREECLARAPGADVRNFVAAVADITGIAVTGSAARQQDTPINSTQTGADDHAN